MGLKVIGAGFGRTATSSLKLALENLGYKPCHHMNEVFASSDQIKWFTQAANGEKVDWDVVFEKYEAAVDWPASAYYKELSEHYPDSKIILSVRDANKWYDSAKETIFTLSHSNPVWLLYLSPRLRQIFAMIHKTVWDGIFSGQFRDRERSINIFNKHIEEVKAAIPKERLLIHEAREGWKPLCDFLGKPIPDMPYPRVNESAVIKKRIKMRRWVARAPWVLVFLVFALLYLMNL